MKFGAYMESPRDMDIYKSGIELYGNAKLESFSDFFREVVLNMKENTFSNVFFRENKNKIQIMYENAKSYPEFFKQLGALVPRKDKCKLFKTWLQMFIREKIRFHGTWVYDLDKISAGGTRRRRRRRAPKTRKAAK
jgi:hypothetical protein